MNASEIKNQIELSAKAERSAGTKVFIDYKLPFISIDLTNGEDYFFQGDEAVHLLDKMSLKADAFDVAIEDAILHSLLDW